MVATIAQRIVDDTLMYSESVATIDWSDVLDADIVFIGIFTFNAQRGYQLAQHIKANSDALVVLGGMHASLNYPEAAQHCDYVLLGEGDESVIDFIQAVSDGAAIDFPGVVYKQKGELVHTGERTAPADIDVSPDYNLLYRYDKMARLNTVWAQVHASRGCPHNCDYCAIIVHLGRGIRTRSPQAVITDIRQTIAFHNRRFLGLIPRMNKIVWLTDDNFFADRKWAISVLQALIDSDINAPFSTQARYEIGFDDEILGLLKQAGFVELVFGIEFLEDDSFEQFNKKCSYDEVVQAIENTQKHGLEVRGLFILGADNHTKGVGQKIADFVIRHRIKGVLIQSMYFTPSTPAYDANKDRLIHSDWKKYDGNVVHYPSMISPYDLQQELITALGTIYSLRRLVRALIFEKWLYKLIFTGEFFWQNSMKANYKRELPYLKSVSEGYSCQSEGG
ncbi:MAG: B12-binding domain-containing radical SAM protein [Coriobacteriia bacterium]|nr:B12-binding domain-containing radical SAM protein [Coriobacteriia bacterium]